MEIDSDHKFTPARPMKKGALTYTDHYAILYSFRNIPLKKQKAYEKKRTIIWNTKKKGSWEHFIKETSNNDQLEEVAKKSNVNEMSNDIEKVMKSIKYKCFGKVSVQRMSREQREVESLQKEKNKQ